MIWCTVFFKFIYHIKKLLRKQSAATTLIQKFIVYKIALLKLKADKGFSDKSGDCITIFNSMQRKECIKQNTFENKNNVTR